MTFTQKSASFTAWVLGIALVLGGGVFLALSTGLVAYTGPTEPVIAGGVGLLALPFFGRWATDRDQWWALLAAYIFLAIAVPVLVFYLTPEQWQIPAVVSLVEVAIPFWVAYLYERERWWASLAGYTALVLAGLTALTLVTASQELLGGVALLATAMPLWAVFIGDRSRTWALVPAIVVTAIAVLILVAVGIVAIAQQGFLFVIINGAFAVVMLVVWLAMRRFDWAIWLAIGFGIAAVLSLFFPPAAGFAALALTVGSYIITRQIDAARAAKQSQTAQQQPAAQPQQPAQPAQPQPSTPPAQASAPAPTPPPAQQPATPPTPTPQPGGQSGAQIDRQASAAHREIEEAAKRATASEQSGSPMTGFRPLNPFEGRETEDDDSDDNAKEGA